MVWYVEVSSPKAIIGRNATTICLQINFLLLLNISQVENIGLLHNTQENNYNAISSDRYSSRIIDINIRVIHVFLKKNIMRSYVICTP